MKPYNIALKKLAARLSPGLWGWVLGAVVFAAVLSLPVEGYALSTYGGQFSYQQNESFNGSTRFVTSQQMFTFFFNLNAQPFSKLPLNASFQFSVVQNTPGTTATALQLQPNTDMHLVLRAVTIGLGYRQAVSNNSIISGVGSQSLTSTSNNAYIDAAFATGRLPSLRFRYSISDSTQFVNGTKTASSAADAFAAGMTYKLGIFSFNANYGYNTTKDNLHGSISNSSSFNEQLNVSRKLGQRIDLLLRETLNYSTGSANGVKNSENYSGVAEARAGFSPFQGAALVADYTYNIAGDLLHHTQAPSTSLFYVNGNYNYAVLRYIKPYASYNETSTQSGTGTSTVTDSTIWGINFNRPLGRFNLTSRFEERLNSSTTSSTGSPSTTSSSKQDLVDWVLGGRLTSFLGLSLSESYGVSSAGGQSSSSNVYRVSMSIGPFLKRLSIGPSVNYTINTAPNGSEVKTTNINIPTSFGLSLHNKVDLNLTDTQAFNSTQAGSSISTSQSNNATIRLSVNRPLPNTNLGADASFSSSSTNASPVVSNSSYSFRAGWAKSGQSVNFNARYQEGNRTISSESFSMQYGLNFRLKKLAAGLQARYDYSMTFSTPATSSQAISFQLYIRK